MSGHGWRWSFEFALNCGRVHVHMQHLPLRRRRPCPPGWTILSCRQRPSEVSKTKMGEGEKLIKMCMTWWFLCCLYMNRCYEKRSKTQFVDRHIDTYHPCQANVHADTYSAHHLIPWKSRKAFFYDKQFVYALGNRALLYLQICSCWRFRGSNSIHAAVE